MSIKEDGSNGNLKMSPGIEMEEAIESVKKLKINENKKINQWISENGGEAKRGVLNLPSQVAYKIGGPEKYGRNVNFIVVLENKSTKFTVSEELRIGDITEFIEKHSGVKVKLLKWGDVIQEWESVGCLNNFMIDMEVLDFI